VASLEAAAKWFGVGAPAAAMAALRATRAPGEVNGERLHDWRYMHRMNLKSLPPGRRALWIWGKLFPTVPHMREMYASQGGFARLWSLRVMHLLKKAR